MSRRPLQEPRGLHGQWGEALYPLLHGEVARGEEKERGEESMTTEEIRAILKKHWGSMRRVAEASGMTPVEVTHALRGENSMRPIPEHKRRIILHEAWVLARQLKGKS